MTDSAAPHGSRYRPRRRTAQIFSALLVVVLLAPVVYMFDQLWTSKGNAVENVATERAATAYARPLNKLLGALVDARSAAVRKSIVDESEVRAAVDEVDGADRRYSGRLQVGQRWNRLAGEIHGTLTRNTDGADAFHAYAGSVALTQALLTRVADSSQSTGDPAGSYRLIDVALRRLPDAVVSADEVTALASMPQKAKAKDAAKAAGAAAVSDPRLAVADDRLGRTADDIGMLLRASSSRRASDVADLHVLTPLDKFAAATNELSQATAELDGSHGGARDSVEEAGSEVKTAALALETAVLNTSDTALRAKAAENATQDRILLLSGVVVPLAAGALLWLVLSGPGAPRASRPAVPDTVASQEEAAERHGRTGEATDAGPDLPEERVLDRVGARAAHAPVGQRAPRDRN